MSAVHPKQEVSSPSWGDPPLATADTRRDEGGQLHAREQELLRELYFMGRELSVPLRAVNTLEESRRSALVLSRHCGRHSPLLGWWGLDGRLVCGVCHPPVCPDRAPWAARCGPATVASLEPAEPVRTRPARRRARRL